MAFPTITVLGKSSNKAYIRFLNKGTPVNVTSTYRMLLELDTKAEIDSDDYPGFFNWNTGIIGVVTLSLGNMWWPTKIYYAKVITFDDLHEEGIYWGNLRIKAIENANTI